ncbi:MAG: UDP-N-acetylglucosamine 1-carboxyvinyltransferase [Helicobacteraceae bacterium]|jgi:UDP-N-acetylglucosamine 1-carboxyvinyltransferase|nr:UDP-N-acetylglucosamine 1-carboxyvinyltransferase [Helicobacteraceae bacterium]
MDCLEITGGASLNGKLIVSGAKNAALPILAATILSKNPVAIANLPNVADIRTFLKLLELLGGGYVKENEIFTIDASKIACVVAAYDIVKTMRASILVLGPLLARYGECRVSLPGGCAIGQRPVDLHLKAMEKMGANISIEEGYIHAKAPRGLKGATIVFDKISVTGSENAVMAAALAKGKSEIVNCAKEPEVVQLCETIAKSGVKIDGIGGDAIEIEGTGGEAPNIPPIRVIPDRIEAGTYLCAAAITNGSLTLERVEPRHMTAVTDKLRQMGFAFEFGADTIRILKSAQIRPVEIVTAEYPGFPTDMQAQMMALATQAEGNSAIEERLFENRFMHVGELARMGAKIALRGNTATISGKTKLIGADVMATDLRASSALVLAALAASGKARIHRIYHLDRGYERMEEKLRAIGAQIERKKEPN